MPCWIWASIAVYVLLPVNVAGDDFFYGVIVDEPALYL